jgi:hypothetical protein
MIDGTIGMIQRTADTIQGTIGMIQGTIGMIQGIIGMIQGTFTWILRITTPYASSNHATMNHSKKSTKYFREPLSRYLIQGTIGMIQGTVSMIQGTIGMIQGTREAATPP